MTKKRFLKLTLIFMVLLYIVSSAFLFFVNYKTNEGGYSNEVDYVFDQLKNVDNMDGSFLDQYSMLSTLKNSDINGVFAVADPDGNLVAKSSQFYCYVKKTFCVSDGDIDSKFYNIFLDSYLTDEAYEKLSKYVRFEEALSHSVSVKKISAYKSGDELIPVEVELKSVGSSEYEKDLKLKITDYKPDYTFEQSDEMFEEKDLISGVESELTDISFFTNVRHKFYNKTFRDMYQNVDKFFSDFHKKYNDQRNVRTNMGIIDDWNEGHHYKKEIIINTLDSQEDVKLATVLYFECNNNLIYDTLTSKDFYSLVLFMAAFFFVTGIIISIVGSKLIKKNEMLNKSRNAFVSAAAHELKTPLAVIANNCECILESVSPEKNTEYVTTVYDETKRMSKMVKSLLEYNKLSTDAKIKKETIDFCEMINREVSNYMPLIESKQIAFSKKMPEKVSLKCDEKLMSMVISNFLSNAVKFTPENGEIKISVAESGGKITFLIFNSGSEISKEDAPHIWEEFYTGSKSRSRDENSTGMGLAVSRAILEMHGLKYCFRNKDNGVLFTFYE